MKIVIPGGSGQVGTILARAFHRDHHDVIVLSREPATRPWPVLSWDAVTPGPWQSAIDGADVVINLAGRSVNCRYTAANRRAILDSRVLSARAVGQAIAASARPPRVWLQASTATIYAHTFGPPNDDVTGVIGGDEPDVPPAWHFSIDVVRAWEAALAEAPAPRTRKVALRSAMTMSPDRGGVFATLLTLVRAGLGGQAGDGRQFMSWIHEHDFIEAVRWLVDHDDIEGPVNLAAPEPLPNAEFMRQLRRAAGVRIGLPATRAMLAIGAMLIRTETELLLKSRRVVPRRLVESGFSFRYPRWEEAARELWRRTTARVT